MLGMSFVVYNGMFATLCEDHHLDLSHIRTVWSRRS
jgi:hypothetical protein